MTNREYLNAVSTTSLNKLITLWASLTDETHGGFGTIDAFGRKDFSSDRSAVMQGRTLYGMSAAYRAVGDERCAHMAERQYVYIRDKLVDRVFGGVWPGVRTDGSCLSMEKAVYENAFVLYGLTEYVLAFQDAEALELAKGIFRGLEKARLFNAPDGVESSAEAGYCDCCSRSWETATERSYGRQRSAKGEYGLDNQSHVMEAYSNLYRVWPDPALRTRLTELTRLACLRLFRQDRKMVGARFDSSWRLIQEDESFGDDAEVSWLISELAQLAGEREWIEAGNTAAVTLTEAVLQKGLDRHNGGVYNGIRAGSLQTRKAWWCQCEAINACLNAYQISGGEKYLERAAELWQFLERWIIAPEGYWRGAVHSDGQEMALEGTKAMPVCAYHNIRTCVKTMALSAGRAAWNGNDYDRNQKGR